jgi:hypothetical protein
MGKGWLFRKTKTDHVLGSSRDGNMKMQLCHYVP